jgi:agmatinase
MKMPGKPPVGEQDIGFGFLNLPEELQRAGTSRVHVLPVPLEETVSYGGGTRRGPEAIIDASRQVELFDRAFGGEPALAYGIHTLPAVRTGDGVEAALARVQAAVAGIVAAGKLPVTLGGEHTVTIGPVRAIAEATARGALHAARAGAEGASSAAPLTVVQVDAHADLRNVYQGSPYSHACVMRRLVEETGCGLCQVGIRSLCAEEDAFIKGHPETVRTFFADDIHADAAGAWLGELAERLRGRRVYLTIDVDGLDPSVVLATGTPEPGGLSWQQAMTVLETVTGAAGGIAGIDCVELAPVPGMHAADFAVAKLLYRAISLAMRRPIPGAIL